MSPDHEGQPGVLHPADQAFYELTVKQRDAAWREVEQLKALAERYQKALKQIEAESHRSFKTVDQTLAAHQRVADLARSVLHSTEGRGHDEAS